MLALLLEPLTLLVDKLFALGSIGLSQKLVKVVASSVALFNFGAEPHTTFEVAESLVANDPLDEAATFHFAIEHVSYALELVDLLSVGAVSLFLLNLLLVIEFVYEVLILIHVILGSLQEHLVGLLVSRLLPSHE